MLCEPVVCFDRFDRAAARLVSLNADPNITAKDGKTPLQVCVRRTNYKSTIFWIWEGCGVRKASFKFLKNLSLSAHYVKLLICAAHSRRKQNLQATGEDHRKSCREETLKNVYSHIDILLSYSSRNLHVWLLVLLHWLHYCFIFLYLWAAWADRLAMFFTKINTFCLLRHFLCFNGTEAAIFSFRFASTFIHSRQLRAFDELEFN